MAFKPSLDNRYSETTIVSHDGRSVPCVVIPVDSCLHHVADCIDKSDRNIKVVAFEECQFFPSEIINICRSLASYGKRVIVAGLDKDYLSRPFSPMSELIIEADYVTKLSAVCVKCGNPASFTYRTDSSDELILVGTKDSYEARCRSCYCEGMDVRK